MEHLNDEQLSQLLRRDGLAEAEELTGKSYKSDDATMAIGFLKHSSLVEQRQSALEALDDTKFSETVRNYLRIAEEEDFEVVLAEDFKGRDRMDTLYILWCEEKAILLHFDTYGSHVNGGKFFYNVRPNEDFLPWEVTSSGGHKDGVYAGDHDCREALRFNIRRLEEHGQFLKPWVRIPHIRLLNYMEWKFEGTSGTYREKSEYYARIHNDRLNRLPPRVLFGMGLDAS